MTVVTFKAQVAGGFAAEAAVPATCPIGRTGIGIHGRFLTLVVGAAAGFGMWVSPIRRMQASSPGGSD